MNKVLFVSVMLLSLSAISIAQDEKGFEKSLLYVDEIGRISDSYYDYDVAPTNPVLKGFDIRSNFVPGSYYTLQGEKVTGYIEYNYNGYKFAYKKSLDEKKYQVIRADVLKSFAIGRDSFVMVDDFRIERKLTSRMMRNPEFTLYLGQVKEYHFYEHDQDGDKTLLFRKGESKEIQMVPRKPEKQKVALEPVVQDMKWLKSVLGTEGFKTKDRLHLVKQMQFAECLKNNESVYYDDYRNELSNVSGHAFRTDILKQEGEFWHLAWLNSNGDTLVTGRFSSLVPLKKEGIGKWFYPNGEVRKMASHVDGRQMGFERRFFENGQVQYDMAVVPEKQMSQYVTWLKKNAYFKGDYSNEPQFDQYLDEVKEDDPLTVTYLNVYDKEGKSLLDKAGNGKETVYDEVMKRTINRTYKSNKLISSYYKDGKGRLVYQYASTPAVFGKNKKFKEVTYTKFKYPIQSVAQGHQGLNLVRLELNDKGDVTNVDMVKTVDTDISQALEQHFKEWKKKLDMKAAKNRKKKVASEIVVPVLFTLDGFNDSKNQWHNTYMYQHHYMQMNQIQNMGSYQPMTF